MGRLLSPGARSKTLLTATAAVILVGIAATPAAAHHEGPPGCLIDGFGITTGSTPLGCAVMMPCPVGGGTCVFDVRLMTRGSGLLDGRFALDGVPAASCGPAVLGCEATTRVTVPEGSAVEAACSTGPDTLAYHAEVGCIPQAVHEA